MMAARRRKQPPGKEEASPAGAGPAAGLHRSTCRGFLILAAFLAGASVMIIELAGNRILAPWFGNSLYTWTGLIGVILISISGGYYLGGYLADRRPDYLLLSHLLATSAALTILVPLFQTGLEQPMAPLGVVWGPVLAATLLFAVPGCLLASVSPFAIRLTSLLTEDRSVGLSAGSIGMFATLGSVVGTFGSGFVLIPHMRLRSVFLVTGLVLAALSVVGYLLFSPRAQKARRLPLVPLVLFGLVTTGVLLSGTEPGDNVIFEQTTFYHKIRVVQRDFDDGDQGRFLLLDNTLEGAQFVRSRQIMHPYGYWELARLFCPHVQSAAFLGGGAFTMPEALLDAFPRASVDVVEIDPAVIEVGRKYFRVDEYARMNAVADDARRFLRTASQRYDLIFGDAYRGVRCVPAHLVTREFFQLVKERLNDGGVYIMNVGSSFEGENAVLFRSIAGTLSQVFEHQCVFLTDPTRPELVQNIFIVAASHDLAPDSIRTRPAVNGELAERMFRGYVRPDQYDLSGGTLLTDDYNPIEYLVAGTLWRDDPTP